MKREINYYIYSPCGNDTALVEGLNFSSEAKKTINDRIMERNKNVEQVGFVQKYSELKLTMAGGEFCGNATRSAVHYYLGGKTGKVEIKVSGVDRLIEAGIDDGQNVWCKYPIYAGTDIARKLDWGIYEIKMDGIVHIIIDNKEAEVYLRDKKNIKQHAMNLIKKFDISESEAVGVMFLEKKDERLSIHPVVWVKPIDTLFYETACGSGSVAVGIYKSIKENKDQSLEILQPSEKVIKTSIKIAEGKLIDAVISSKITSDGILRKIEIDI